MTPEHIQAVLDAYETMETSDTSVVLPNSSFGYWKIVVERPLRLRSRFTREAVEALRSRVGTAPCERRCTPSSVTPCSTILPASPSG